MTTWSETRALGNLASMYADARDVERAIDYTQRTNDTASRYQLRSWENLARVLHAKLDLWTGDWAAAENAATDVLGSSSFIDDIAWRVLANVSIRAGRQEAPAMAYRLWSTRRCQRRVDRR